MVEKSPAKNDIDAIAREIARQIRDFERTLTLAFVTHESGRRDEAISLDEPSLLEHPAGVFVRHLLRKRPENEGSAFYGLSIRTTRYFLGLLRRVSALGLATVNAEDFTSTAEVRAQLYNFAWHALDLVAARQKPEHRGRFDNGPMIPRRNALGQGRANLKADAFAAAIVAFQGDKAGAQHLGARRALQSLEARNGWNPALFPFPLAAESAHFAIAEVLKSPVPRTRAVTLARQVAEDVGATVDESLLRQWRAFCAPAQDMAWRGYEPARILGAAIHASEDPYIRAIGYLVAEATGILPMPVTDVRKEYNAFADPEINARTHREMTEDVFAEAMAQGVYENSSSPFIAAANAQNKSLTEGRILGWCAAALQAAGRAFDLALASDRPPSQAAHERFTTARNETDWETLNGLASKIVARRQDGHAITLAAVARLCDQTDGLAPISESVALSLKDPAFAARLEAANALTATPAPTEPALGLRPAGPAPQAPALAAAPPGPSLGGGTPATRFAQKPKTVPASTGGRATAQSSKTGDEHAT